MRKGLCCLLALCLLLPGFSPIIRTNAQAYATAEEAVNDANKFLEDKLELVDYYLWEINGKSLNKEYAQKGTEAFLNRPIFVYGDQAAASKEATSSGNKSVKNGIYRAMGYTVEESAFPNPDFPHDNEGYLDEHKKWVKLPWVEGITKEVYDGVDGSKSSRVLTEGAANLIKKWTNKDTIFKPDEVEPLIGQRDFFASRAEDVPPALKDNFEDFLYIVQPPTEHSWGLGVAFYYWDGFNRFNYKTFLLKPFNMVSEDLSAEFTNLPYWSLHGEEVTVGVSVKSTFPEDVIGVPFKWELTNAADGTPLAATFGGHATVSKGYIQKIPAQGERVFYASFPMPDNDVEIKFAVNQEGQSPPEQNVHNNFLAALIKKDTPSGIFDLDYNILSRQVKYPVSQTEIEANLDLPKGHWDGNAGGALAVENQTTNLLRNFSVTNNPVVDEPSTRIVRRPDINTTFYRTDFGDDPQNGYWLNPPLPEEPQKRSGSVAYSGSAHRRYEYTWHCEEKNCSGHTGHGTASAEFASGRDTKIIKAFSYNGMATIMPKIFENKIEDNHNQTREKNLYWTSEPYQFKVIRWMFHLDQDDNLYNGTPVLGQYQRTFTQQCSGLTTWTTPRTMANDYERGREAARERDYRKEEYDKAVFATDIDFRDVDYPVKSGYYFNPTGEYTFTVKTVTYNEAKRCPPLLQVAGTIFVVQQAVSISPASLKRAEVRKFFYNRKIF